MPIEVTTEGINNGSIDLDSMINNAQPSVNLTPVETVDPPSDANPTPDAVIKLRKDIAVPTADLGSKDQAIEQGDPSNRQQAAPSIESFLAEKSGGKYKTWDDVEAALGQTSQSPSIEFPDDFSRGVFENLMAGKTDEVAEVLSMQRRLKDVDSWDNERAVREAMAIQHPDWTAEDIDDEYNAKIPVATEDDEPSVKRRATRALNEQAREAKEYLAGLRKELKIPEVKAPISQGPAVDPAKVAKAREQYLNGVKSAKDAFKGYEFDVADDDFEIKTRFNLDPAEQSSFMNKMEKEDIIDSTFQSNYLKEDGSYNVEAMAKDMWLLQRDEKGVSNYEKVVASQMKQVFTEAKRAILASFKGRPEVQGLPGNAGQPRLRSDIENYLKQTS